MNPSLLYRNKFQSSFPMRLENNQSSTLHKVKCRNISTTDGKFNKTFASSGEALSILKHVASSHRLVAIAESIEDNLLRCRNVNVFSLLQFLCRLFFQYLKARHSNYRITFTFQNEFRELVLGDLKLSRSSLASSIDRNYVPTVQQLFQASNYNLVLDKSLSAQRNSPSYYKLM